MTGALDDVLVVDLTTAFWSSLGTALLADFGARVIRVERLGASPPPRDAGGVWNWDTELANRNKTSLALDLAAPRGREILHALIDTATVVVTDQPRTVIDELGLDADTLMARRPDLLYVRASGFGPNGPDRELPALDELAAARTGMMGILPQPGRPPVYPGHGQMYTTVMLAFGVAAALNHRSQTGEGQVIDVSLLAGNMYGASLDLQAFLAIGGERFLRPLARLDGGNPMSGILYPTRDGRWVTLTMPDTDRWWPALSDIVGLDVRDPRFDSHEKRCEVNRLELIRLLDERFRLEPADHWRRTFNERQMSADVIEEYAYPAADEQARRNRYVLDLEDPSLGPVKTIGFPIFMTDTPARLDRRAPAAGQHSAAILHEVLGYSEDQITALVAEGVVA